MENPICPLLTMNLERPTTDGTISVRFSQIYPRTQANCPMKLSDEWADLEVDVDGTQGCIAALRNLKQQHPQLKIILSIGGGSPEGSGHFARIASQTVTREIFARSARELCQLHGFDGQSARSISEQFRLVTFSNRC